MDTPENLFEQIATRLLAVEQDVSIGKMMSSPGLKFQNKVFAFFHKDQMGFRLGPGFDPSNHHLTNAKPLSPFKSKPPLKGWFMIDESDSATWESLTEMALDYTKTLKK